MIGQRFSVFVGIVLTGINGWYLLNPFRQPTFATILASLFALCVLMLFGGFAGTAFGTKKKRKGNVKIHS